MPKSNARTKNDFDYPVLRDFPDDMTLTVCNEYAMLTKEWWDICTKCLPENYIKDNWIMLEIISKLSTERSDIWLRSVLWLSLQYISV